MPGVTSGQFSGKLPVQLPVQLINIFKSASSIPNDVLEALASKSRDSNVILPCLLESLAKEKSGEIPAHDQVWITCTSYDRQPTVDLVLSCTEGPMGPYPVFIVSLRPFASLTHQYLLPLLIALASALHDTVPVNRVYSVFAPEPITMLFVSLWTELTGVGSYAREPYYAAKLSYCTKSSLSKRQTTVHPDLVYDLRPADDDDIMDVAELCHDFAAVSDPFVLTPDAAIEEATILVRKEQIWVHRVCKPDGTGSEIASIVAFTRNTDTVSTVTKVFTNPKWRRRGCAERLVRRVCKHLLLTAESVALYVAHDNLGATKVYARVGFVGLAANSPPVDGVYPWLELGLDREKVQLGHW